MEESRDGGACKNSLMFVKQPTLEATSHVQCVILFYAANQARLLTFHSNTISLGIAVSQSAMPK